MKELKIKYGKLLKPICLVLGHNLNQPKTFVGKKGYINFQITNIVYCKRCDEYLGTTEYKYE
jgi:hypothetical protein